MNGDKGWLQLPVGIVPTDGRRARRNKRRAREVSILAWSTYREKVRELQERVRYAIRRGHTRKAVRLTEEIRQMVKARKSARRALRAAQLELFPQ